VLEIMLCKGLIIAPDATQLNSTGSWVELSRVGRVIILNRALWSRQKLSC